jgi:hypothetical protein
LGWLFTWGDDVDERVLPGPGRCGVVVADDDEQVPRSRQRDVEARTFAREAHLPGLVAAGHRVDDHLGVPALEPIDRVDRQLQQGAGEMRCQTLFQ